MMFDFRAAFCTLKDSSRFRFVRSKTWLARRILGQAGCTVLSKRARAKVAARLSGPFVEQFLATFGGFVPTWKPRQIVKWTFLPTSLRDVRIARFANSSPFEAILRTQVWLSDNERVRTFTCEWIAKGVESDFESSQVFLLSVSEVK